MWAFITIAVTSPFSSSGGPTASMIFPMKQCWSRMGYEPEQMEQFISRYDIIAPKAENMYETAWDNYRRAPYHFIEDLQLVAQLVQQNHPDYRQATQQYLNGTALYLKNMYIMRGELFQQYCSWLFPLLEQFDRQNHWQKYQNHRAALRVDGYLAERLFGIWYTHLKQQGQVRSCELPRIHFANLDGGKGTLKAMKLVNALLPPGTRRRSVASRGARRVLQERANKNISKK